ncbi:MAG: PAS domain S-box protein [Bacteroidota bacterium]
MSDNSAMKGKLRLTIGTKIFMGFLSLILLAVIVVAVIFWKGSVIDNSTKFSSENARPSKEAINEFVLMVTQSKMLITNWVYLQTNTDDKEALRQIKDFDYPALKERITKLMPNWSDSQRVKIDTVFANFENMMATAEDQVMNKLITFENYEDPLTKLLAEDAIESQIIPQSADLIKRLNEIVAIQNKITEESDQEIIQSTSELYYYTLILGGVIVVLGFVIAYYIVRSITNPILYIKDVVVKLGKGELVEDQNKKFSNDEIGEMALATDNLVAGLKATTQFAENIGNGKYDSEFQPLSEHDVLGNALLNMRENLARVAEEDKKRNWATEGLAKFGEILRTNNNDVQKLSDEIIGNLVKYLKANQGALYIIDDNEGDDPTMSMTACYAWDKKKYLNQKIHRGEGLAGQCWQEMDLIFLTDVPQNYIRITSGLGDANPNCILIVPLKVNDQIFGVVELASFNVLKDYEIEFVQKIAESIASTISSVKINARTQRLLEESQQMTEQMRAQEEEMRQNMEELQATQEEMQRGQSETEGTLRAMNESLAIVEFDPEGNILKANHNFLDMMGYSLSEIQGEHHRLFVHKDDRSSDAYRQFWRDLANGRSVKGEFRRVTKKGDQVWIRGSYSPLRNKNGEVVKVMEIMFDITALKKATATA